MAVSLPKFRQVTKFIKKRRKGLVHAGFWLTLFLVAFVLPPTRITSERLIDLLSNRRPPTWVKLPEGAKIDVETTKQFKRQKLTEFDAKLAVVGQDVEHLFGLKPAAAAVAGSHTPQGWPKFNQDLAAAGNTLVDFWGVSILTYHGETIIMGEGSTPINMSDRVLRWQKDIEASAAKYHVEPALIAAVIETESGGDPEALSPVGAIGLMQLMPRTAQGLGVNPYDPAQNIDGGTHYLQIQLNRFGSLDGALAAYNAGPGNVSNGHWVMLPETMHYVDKVPKLKAKYERIWQEHAQAEAAKTQAVKSR